MTVLELVLTRAAELTAEADETQFFLVEDVLGALVTELRGVTATVGNATIWATMVDEVSRIVGCETKSQRLAVQALVLAAMRLTEKG